MNKQLIIPIVTPAGIPSEKDLPVALHTGEITIHGAEGESCKKHMVR